MTKNIFIKKCAQTLNVQNYFINNFNKNKDEKNIFYKISVQILKINL